MKKLAIELGQRIVRLPSFIFSAFLHFVKKTILNMAKFNIKDLDILKFSL